ncbi:ras GEF [Wolfiporia cocos MD-104 SS10]|uniref:Ras GEF n=1 Tax=Wolfiporia cocos (strain MD-104) TaxID=742152 RepID=A0A2H3IXD7_WOLCO|nr:ras GEF [Wolfiporia cocos MD-104 SS10]
MAAISRAPSLRRGGPLPRLWIDPSLTSYRQSQHSPVSTTSPSSHVSDATTLSDSPFSAETFRVLCLYDYDAADSDQLSFRKNELLDIIKREDTGWWAAMRLSDNRVGWIPQTFVEPISEVTAHRLRHSDDGARIREAPREASTRTIVTTPEGGATGYNWLPLLDEEQAPVIRLFAGSDAKDASIFSPLVPPPEGVDGHPHDPEFDTQGAGSDSEEPPSPPPKDRSILTQSKLQTQRHSSPITSTSEVHALEHSRSYSDPASPAISRHLRRRPVLIDDRSSLSRLTTLFETKNIEELDSLLRSPAIAESLDALSPVSARGYAFVRSPTQGAVQRHTSPLRSSSSEQGDNTDLQRDADGNIMAGSLHALLEQLTSDDTGFAHQQHFQRVFFSTYKTFVTADEVFIFLFSRFHMGQPDFESNWELDKWREEKLEPTQRRILAIFKLWAEEYGMSRDDPHIARRLNEFLTSLIPDSPFVATAQSLMEILRRSAYPVSPCTASAKRKKRKGSKTDFARMDPMAIARHLCLYQHRLYGKLRPQDCLNWKSSTSHCCTSLAAFCATRDKLAGWVKASILSTEVFSKRADMLAFWIKTAEACKALHNFSSMGAIAAGLSDSAIVRQQLLWAHVPRGMHPDALMLLNDPINNQSAYRLLQQSVDGPCIPAPELYLSEIVQIREQLPDFVVLPAASPAGHTSRQDASNTLINFAKRMKMYAAAESMLRYQTHSYSFAEDPLIADLIEANLTVGTEAAPPKRRQDSLDANVTNIRQKLNTW